jgi:hypothetical protein
MPRAKAINPFYVALLPVGALFAITACAFGVMMVHGTQPGGPTDADVPGGLLGLMEEHGLAILLVELGMLAVLTMLAIGSDSYWTREGADAKETRP